MRQRIEGFADGVALMGIAALMAQALLPLALAVAGVSVLMLSLLLAARTPRGVIWLSRAIREIRPLSGDKPDQSPEKQQRAEDIERDAKR